MEEELTQKKGNGKKKYRESVKCEKCDSRFVTVKVKGDIRCRRCGHLTLAKEEKQ